MEPLFNPYGKYALYLNNSAIVCLTSPPAPLQFGEGRNCLWQGGVRFTHLHDDIDLRFLTIACRDEDNLLWLRAVDKALGDFTRQGDLNRLRFTNLR